MKVRFADRDCRSCTERFRCVRSEAGQSRTLVLPERALYEALQQARINIASEAGRKEYQKRSGIEASLSQGVRRCDLRHARYLGLAKTKLQHVATAAALDIVRVVNHLQGKPLAVTRTSAFARIPA